MITQNSWDSENPVQVSRGGSGQSNLTDHNILIGNEANPITLLPPNATSGIPLVSTGSGADPAYFTAEVAGGGSGAISFNTFEVLTSGTTNTGPFQSIDNGSTGNVLTSNGTGNLPSFQTAGGAGGILVQQVRDITVTRIVCNNDIDYGSSIPQITEGTEIFSHDFTATNSNNIILFQISLFIGAQITEAVVAALFKDSISNAFEAYPGGTISGPSTGFMTFNHFEVAGDTNLHTYSLRVGPHSGSIDVNGNGNNEKLGGAAFSNWIISEIKI